MAKFLPFVVEKSTPEYIFQILIARSKGMNNLLVASIFYLVLDKGIETVRSMAEAMPEMPLDKLYSELLNANATHMITNMDFKRFQALRYLIEEHLMDTIDNKLREYTTSDILNFLLVMCLTTNLTPYTSMRLDNLLTGKAEKSEKDLIKSKLFSSDGKPKYFATREELTAYVHFYSLIWAGGKPDAVRAIYISVDPGKDSPSYYNSDGVPKYENKSSDDSADSASYGVPEPKAAVPDPRGKPDKYPDSSPKPRGTGIPPLPPRSEI